jgi:hypothetical protein
MQKTVHVITEMDEQQDEETDAQDEHEILSVAVGKQTTDLLCVVMC